MKYKGLLFIGVLVCLYASLWIFEKRVYVNKSTKTCLITGVSSGIGKNLAIEMFRKGWKVIGIARRTKLLENLQKMLGPDFFVLYTCDVSNPEDIHRVSEDIKKQGLRPTLFFLNAGTGVLETKGVVATVDHRKTFATNYFGVVSWVEEWLPFLKQQRGGTFVATSSVLALFSPPGSSAYAASKAALVSCFQALRLCYLNDNIGFSVVLPGPVQTELLKSPRPLPFIHQPEEEARYIVEQVFEGKKQIEPSWIYSLGLRLINVLPDWIVLKAMGVDEVIVKHDLRSVIKADKMYKIIVPADFDATNADDCLKRSSLDVSSGFIHASKGFAQLTNVLAKFFADHKELLILELDEKVFSQAPFILRFEPNKPGGDVYPHIYGGMKIPYAAVTAHIKITRNSNNEWLVAE